MAKKLPTVIPRIAYADITSTEYPRISAICARKRPRINLNNPAMSSDIAIGTKSILPPRYPRSTPDAATKSTEGAIERMESVDFVFPITDAKPFEKKCKYECKEKTEYS